MNDQPFKHLTIIGLGLIGGSVAMSARERFPGLQIHAIDAQPETLQYAIKLSLTDSVSLTLPNRFEDNQLIVLATHLADSQDYLERLSRLIQPEQDIVVTDVGSCKRRIAALGQNLLPNQFIPGHPMAGRELSGVQHANSLMFAGKTWILCPSEPSLLDKLDKSNRQAYQDKLHRLEAFLIKLGAQISRMNPERHDRVMAYVSHFPQLYAVLYANLLQQNRPGELLSFQGGGMDDQLRLAGSSAAMWHDIWVENQDNLCQVLTQFQTLLSDFSEVGLQTTSDAKAIPPLFHQANQLYREWKEFRRNPVV